MPSMQLNRLGDLNLVYKIKEVLEDNAWTSDNYRVIDGYPNNIDLTTGELWPTVSLEMNNLFGRNVELGSKKWPSFYFAIDVFANTDSQRDDISYILWKALDENYFTLYDFNDGFPAAVGNYAGLTSIGSYYIDELAINNLVPPAGTEIEGEKHHAIIDGVCHLPNI